MCRGLVGDLTALGAVWEGGLEGPDFGRFFDFLNAFNHVSDPDSSSTAVQGGALGSREHACSVTSGWIGVVFTPGAEN